MKALTLICLSGLSLAALLSGQSIDESQLRGNFPFNETLYIVQQPAVNGACGATLTGPVTSSIITDTGFWAFDGAGHVSIKDAGIFILTNPPTDASQVQPEAATCEGTYTMLSTSSVDFHYKCSTDKGTSYFQVHTTGQITHDNILVESYNNADGSLQVTPYIVGSEIVGCSYISENTIVSRTNR